jgi:hypothetical protein
MLDPLFDNIRSLHDRYARVILATIAALILPLMVMTTVATLDNWRQDKDRDHLLECFDQYANEQSTGSVIIREKMVAVDAATAVRDDALNAEGIAFQRLVNHLLTKKVSPTDVQMLADTLHDRSHAAKELDKAQAALDKAREENPVPDPPSEFCAND